jgi:hypothetical protein
MANKTSIKSTKVAKKAAAKRVAAKVAKRRKAAPKSQSRKVAKPALLAGGNPQIAKADGDAPVQTYIAAMPGWKSDVGRGLDALIVRTVPSVRKAVKWNSPFYGIDGQGWFLNFHCFTKYVEVAFFRGTSLRPVPPRRVQAQGSALPRHPRGRPARRGADGDVDPAGGRPARLGPVAPARISWRALLGSVPRAVFMVMHSDFDLGTSSLPSMSPKDEIIPPRAMRR